jgi:hypothetical protein
MRLRLAIGVPALGVAALVMMGASGCATTAPQTQASSRPPTASQGFASVAPPSTSTAPNPAPLGTELSDPANGFAVTALQYQQVYPKAFNTPPAGGYFAAADVRQCTTGGENNFATQPSIWMLVTSDASQVRAEQDASLVNLPGPALPVGATVDTGKCLSGWVEFIVPGGTTPTEIALPEDGFFWTLR